MSQRPEAAPPGPRAGHSPFHILVELLALIGLVARLRPLFFPADLMFRSFPTEDGYLMLTVARNLALGLGMSTSAGTIPTNGVQPLATLLQALCFRAAGADRELGIRTLIVVSTAIALAAAWLIFRLGVRIMGGSEAARDAALLGAAVWLCSPVVLFTSMNMLETGLYAAVVTGVLLLFARRDGGAPRPSRWEWCLGMGALLGAAFWARNDAVLLMAAIGIAHLGTRSPRTPLARRAAEVAVMAAAAIAVSLPWLGWCRSRFGSVVPVSGQAYLGGGDPVAALRWAAVALFEHLTLLASWEHHPVQHATPFVVFCGAGFSLLAALALRRLRRARSGGRRLPALPGGGPGSIQSGSAAPAVAVGNGPGALEPGSGAVILAVVLFGTGLLVFYTFFFDAPHFLRRYLFPLTPLFALLWGAAGIGLWRRVRSGRLRRIAPVILLGLLVNFVGRDGLLVGGPWRTGVFFRSVEWIERSVPEETWLGAFQSGTLGFFHDRTINLDGKVNPAALEAIRHGRLQAYVVESPIEYVIDWASIVEPWARADAIIDRHFVWDVRDPAGNFAVLRRRPFSRPEER